MSVKSQQVTKDATAKRAQAAPAVMNRVRGLAGNHRLRRSRIESETIENHADETAVLRRMPEPGHGACQQQDQGVEAPDQILPVKMKSLEVSNPTDALEKEADWVARTVTDGGSARIHGTGGTVNRKGEGSVEITPEFRSALASSRGGGQLLDDFTRREMESRMGADFSGIRLHTGSDAHKMNEGVGAKAFTYGQHVYFKSGNYDPNSKQGRELLVHELVHTQQQKNLGAHDERLIHRKEDVPGGLAKLKKLEKNKAQLANRNQQQSQLDVILKAREDALPRKERRKYRRKERKRKLNEGEFTKSKGKISALSGHYKKRLKRLTRQNRSKAIGRVEKRAGKRLEKWVGKQNTARDDYNKLTSEITEHKRNLLKDYEVSILEDQLSISSAGTPLETASGTVQEQTLKLMDEIHAYATGSAEDVTKSADKKEKDEKEKGETRKKKKRTDALSQYEKLLKSNDLTAAETKLCMQEFTERLDLIELNGQQIAREVITTMISEDHPQLPVTDLKMVLRYFTAGKLTSDDTRELVKFVMKYLPEDKDLGAVFGYDEDQVDPKILKDTVSKGFVKTSFDSDAERKAFEEQSREDSRRNLRLGKLLEKKKSGQPLSGRVKRLASRLTDKGYTGYYAGASGKRAYTEQRKFLEQRLIPLSDQLEQDRAAAQGVKSQPPGRLPNVPVTTRQISSFLGMTMPNQFTIAQDKIRAAGLSESPADVNQAKLDYLNANPSFALGLLSGALSDKYTNKTLTKDDLTAVDVFPEVDSKYKKAGWLMTPNEYQTAYQVPAISSILTPYQKPVSSFLLDNLMRSSGVANELLGTSEYVKRAAPILYKEHPTAAWISGLTAATVAGIPLSRDILRNVKSENYFGDAASLLNIIKPSGKAILGKFGVSYEAGNRTYSPITATLNYGAGGTTSVLDKQTMSSLSYTSPQQGNLQKDLDKYSARTGFKLNLDLNKKIDYQGKSILDVTAGPYASGLAALANPQNHQGFLQVVESQMSKFDANDLLNYVKTGNPASLSSKYQPTNDHRLDYTVGFKAALMLRGLTLKGDAGYTSVNNLDPVHGKYEQKSLKTSAAYDYVFGPRTSLTVQGGFGAISKDLTNAWKQKSSVIDSSLGAKITSTRKYGTHELSKFEAGLMYQNTTGVVPTTGRTISLNADYARNLQLEGSRLQHLVLGFSAGYSIDTKKLQALLTFGLNF